MGEAGPTEGGAACTPPCSPILAETWPHSCRLHRHRETVLLGPPARTSHEQGAGRTQSQQPSSAPPPLSAHRVPACHLLHSLTQPLRPGHLGALPAQASRPAPLHPPTASWSLCPSGPVAASPRSPTSTDAARRGPPLITCLKQMLSGAVGVQAVARVTPRCSRTPTCLHTGATEKLRPRPARDPSQEGMSCFPPHGGGMGREGTPPDKQPPCKQTGDRGSLADSGNRLGGE